MPKRSSGPLFGMLRGPQVCYSPDEPAAEVVAPVVETPALVETPADDSIFGDGELNQIFAFDPFGQGTETAPTEPVVTTPPTGAETQVAPVQPETPVAPLPDALTQSLQELVTTLKKPDAPATGSETTSAPAEPENVFADVDIPDTLIAGMASENPQERKVATNVVIQGAMNMVYRKTMEEFGGFIRQGLPQIMGSFIAAQQTAQTVETDFYGTFTNLNKPELKPFVTHIAGQMQQEDTWKGKPWSPQFRDALGERVLRTLAAATANTAPAAPVLPAPPVVPFTPGPQVRVQSTNDGSQEILDILGFQ